jgi:hypothetical protein
MIRESEDLLGKQFQTPRGIGYGIISSKRFLMPGLDPSQGTPTEPFFLFYKDRGGENGHHMEGLKMNGFLILINI